MEGICPQCGIAYAKWQQAAAAAGSVLPGQTGDDASTYIEYQTQSLSERLLAVPDAVDATVFYGRAACYAALFIWGWSFILGGVNWESIGSSFMHNINLPFHEFGHVLFSFFGRFMMILGGSLFQVLLPLGLMLVFIFQRQDNFAASVMLWWCGQSFIDVSPYIADAPYRVLPLVGGAGESSHDWGNLLTMTGKVDSALSYANTSFGIGVILMLLSFGWGGVLLLRQRRNIQS